MSSDLELLDPPGEVSGVDVLDTYGDILSDAFRIAIGSAHLGENDRALQAYRDKPTEFVAEVLGQRLWAGQRYTMEALVEHRRVTHRSCRKSGKTFGAGGLVLNFGSVGPCVILTSAPTGRQVREFLWSRIRTAFNTSRRRLPGRMLTTAWRVEPDWYAIGVSTDDPDNFLGFHGSVEPPDDIDELEWIDEDPLRLNDDGISDDAGLGELHVDVPELLERAQVGGGRLLVVLDEAPGIDPAMYEVIQGSLAGPNTYALQQGNPLMDAAEAHPFARSFDEGSGWHRIHTSAFRPDEGEDDVAADKAFFGVPAWLLERGWARARLKEWGRESSAFRAHVGGMFGRSGMGASLVMPRSLLQSAEARRGRSDQGKHMGVDVALEGDECVASLQDDGVKTAQHSWRTGNLMATADLIVTLGKKWGVQASHIHIDVIGLGAGVVSRLHQMGFHVDGVDFGASPAGDWSHLFGETRPRNRRAELHWVARRAYEEGLGHMPSRWTDSCKQAMWATFEIKAEGGSGSLLTIEPKAKIKARHGRSPDHWDADLLAWARTGQSQRVRVMRRGRR